MIDERDPMAPGLTDEERLRILENNQAELLKKLAGFTAELYGTEPGAAEGAERDIRKVMTGIGADLWGQTGSPTAPVTEKPKEKAIPAREIVTDIWKTADETIEWTEALGAAYPPDGLTEGKRWRFLHEMAPRVLAGDTEAYQKVLETLRPLDELGSYMEKCVLRVNSAERITCEFACKKDRMTGKTAEYPGGPAVRIARDLLAALPVGEVHVKASLGDQRLLEVTVKREQLVRRNPLFLEPATLIAECGGYLDAGEVTRI